MRRRTSFSRALLVLGGVALLALLAVAALLLGGALSDGGRTTAPEAAHASAANAVGEPDHASAPIHGIHQQPSTRARSGVAFAVLAAAVMVATWAFRRIRHQRAGRLRMLRIAGLPPGRGPPALRIA